MEAAEYDGYISEEEEEEVPSVTMCGDNNGVEVAEHCAVICANRKENGPAL